MEFKKIVIVLSIALAIIIGIMFGISYAWYAYSNAETIAKGSTLKETPTVIFAQTEYVLASVTTPIYDSDKYEYANKNSFTVTLDENLSKYTTSIKIILQNIKISEELKNKNYKYELLEDGKIVGSGNFENIGTSTEVLLMPLKTLEPTSYPQTYNYELYMWLSEDGTNQNELMNKGISAKINVVSAIKK